MDVRNTIEAILFALGRKISAEEISNNLEMDLETVKKTLEDIYADYSSKNGGIVVSKINGCYQFVTNKKEYANVAKFVQSSKCENLTNTCMEVLSIIAYNPNITKSRVEQIRGVNSDSQVSRLLEYGLIEETGRLNSAGKPATFAITAEFLRNMGIEKIEQLPDYCEIKKALQENDEESEVSENVT